MSGVTINFAVPASGASATLSSPTAVTNNLGVASITATANLAAGTYNVTASIAGVAGSAMFVLTNLPGPPKSLKASGGTPQSSVVNTPFSTALQATVADAAGNPLSGVTVTFAAPVGRERGTIQHYGSDE